MPQVHDRCDDSSSTEAASRDFDEFKFRSARASLHSGTERRPGLPEAPCADAYPWPVCLKWDAEHRKSCENGLPRTANADLDKLRAEVAHLIAVAEQD